MESNGSVGWNPEEPPHEARLRRAKRGLFVHPPIAAILWLLAAAVSDVASGRVGSALVTLLLVLAVLQSLVACTVVANLLDAGRYDPTYRTLLGAIGLIVGLSLLTAGLYALFLPDITDAWEERAEDRVERLREDLEAIDAAADAPAAVGDLLRARRRALAFLALAVVGPVLVGVAGGALAVVGYLLLRTEPPVDGCPSE
ncbi:hypothetical protein [Halegenticoccus soli]|uniref:hypothetical protein n=1 Tax=Halegenticoccus soli TaxID=1985678 RepID=UPI000C6DB6E0|nr:hypothetical protein [Halegenticoccus soli]